ncbi:PREDICTED: axoneme-associated protein mst101(2)-like isoform X2 [Nelumbo nucifera]|uniref:Axoneme-associated protein mst101(2)-like isoform X2 n=1 Tax=Nelumbo nucifera TaxID=4432 RepID=A0A1U8AH37_NELNU|nr:PREDICTED: axoneme-associated protein mst101(2)-like isoform X2 [Nelumbo nucifera]
MDEFRVSELGSPIVITEVDAKDNENCSISKLISFLQSAYKPADFQKVERILTSREEKMRIQIKGLQVEVKRSSEELKVKGTERRCVELEKELEVYRTRCRELEEKNMKAQNDCTVLSMELEKRKKEYETLKGSKLDIEDKLKEYKSSYDELKQRFTRLEEDHKVICEREKNAEERNTNLSEEIKKIKEDAEEMYFQLKRENRLLERVKRKSKSEIKVWKKELGELNLRVIRLEEKDIALRATQEGDLPETVPCNDKDKNEVRTTSKIQNDVNRGISSPGLVDQQNKEKLLNADGKINCCANVGSTCLSPIKGSKPVQVQVQGPPSIFVNAQEENKRAPMEYGTKVFKSEENKKINPSTVTNARPAFGGVIDISDSDDETCTTTVPSTNIGNAGETSTLVEELKCLKWRHSDQRGGNDRNCEENFPFTSTSKRKRIISIESEGDDDEDKVSISKYMTKKHQELGRKPFCSPMTHSVAPIVFSQGDNAEESMAARQHLITLRKCEEKMGETEKFSMSQLGNSASKYQNPLNKTVKHAEEDEMEETGSEGEGESLGGYIVNGFGDSNCKSASSDSDCVVESEAYEHIASRTQRSKRDKLEWEYVADMISSFDKDPKLCMKAVCALYRQQASKEKSIKGSLCSNSQGFNKLDALRGTILAEFLTDGDPQGDLKKSVEELEKYDPRGLEECKKLAINHSAQLFNIYRNKEDPLFLANRTN